MSFDFSDLVLPEDVNETDFFNYDNFLSDPIYAWLIKPEEVLSACADLDKEIKEQNKPKRKKLQLFNNHNHSLLLIIKKLIIDEDLTKKTKNN